MRVCGARSAWQRPPSITVEVGTTGITAQSTCVVMLTIAEIVVLLWQIALVISFAGTIPGGHKIRIHLARGGWHPVSCRASLCWIFLDSARSSKRTLVASIARIPSSRGNMERIFPLLVSTLKRKFTSTFSGKHLGNSGVNELVTLLSPWPVLSDLKKDDQQGAPQTAQGQEDIMVCDVALTLNRKP
jgi:hypothetical protein